MNFYGLKSTPYVHMIFLIIYNLESLGPSSHSALQIAIASFFSSNSSLPVIAILDFAKSSRDNP
ncbi:hypothetical protein DOY81_010644 [Sarcophaga bullata]|nr:hypothetical protein DOY81_010644 [Sarcophaga bullata]